MRENLFIATKQQIRRYRRRRDELSWYANRLSPINSSMPYVVP